MCDVSKVAFCGLFCGNCIIREAELGKQSQQLLGHMNTDAFRSLASGLPKLKPELFDGLTQYEACCRALEAMSHLDCSKPCKEGGGTDGCPIRDCCTKKQIPGCWACDEFETCKTLAWLEPVNKDAHLRNIHVIRLHGMDEFLRGEKRW